MYQLSTLHDEIVKQGKGWNFAATKQQNHQPYNDYSLPSKDKRNL
jgi:hypothetical protein